MVKLPDVPVIVNAVAPTVAEPLAVKVSTVLPLAGLGLNEAVTPLGRPEAEKVTLPLNPSSGLMVMVVVTWLPCVTLTVFGEGDKVKSGPAGPVSALIRSAPFGLPQPPHRL